MNKVAVLGDGILGKELCKQKNFKCFSRRKRNFNIYEIESLSKIIVDHDIIINCIANTNSYSQDFKSHWEVNYVFVKNLVALINKHNKKLIHISTEFVYSMNSGNPSETDEPIPNLSYYSMSKLFADKYPHFTPGKEGQTTETRGQGRTQIFFQGDGAKNLLCNKAPGI